MFNFSYLPTFKYLLIRSVKISSPGLIDKIINNTFWSALNIIIYTFVMPSMGLDASIGSFMAATLPISCAFFASINSIYAFLTDITSEGSALTYELTLPIPQWLVFTKYAFENMYQALITSLTILPVAVMILWHSFSFTHVSLVKFHFMLIIASLFFGFFSIFITSCCKNIYSGLDNIWTRIIFPLWFLGGFQFSWKTLYSVSPTLAYINLLNPLTYAMEGSRATLLDPALSIPYWLCIGMLLLFTGIFGYWATIILKKRLDCL